MRWKQYGVGFLAGLSVSLAVAQESPQPPDAKKVSYAFGMNLAVQIKQMGADVDVDTVIQAIKDVQEGKPTKLQASELPPIFKQQQDAARARITAKDKAEGEAFLAQNATNSGVTVLPDGLQYRVLQAGAGASPKVTDVVVLNYCGKLIDGTEFDRRDKMQTTVATQMKGWQEVLPQMKVGAKWEIFLPPSLAYGRNWLRKIGPESTVIFDLELVAVAPPTAASEGPRVIPQ
jgi:FKBP-type peptidyl-prolyl cis-trans isomerase